MTTNVRIREDLVPELKRRAKDDKHASLNGLVNEICRSFIHAEHQGTTPVGMMKILDDDLRASVQTDQLWMVLCSETLTPTPRGILVGSPQRNFAFVGKVARVTPTMIELEWPGVYALGLESVAIARTQLLAWWRVKVTENDQETARRIEQILGRKEDPLACAVRRETSRFFGCGGADRFELDPDDANKIAAHNQQVHMKDNQDHIERCPMRISMRFGTDNTGYQLTTARKPSEPVAPTSMRGRDPVRVCGLEINLPSGGWLHRFMIGGSPDLLVRPESTPDGAPIHIPPGRTRIESMRAYPILIHPNQAFLEIVPDGVIKETKEGDLFQDGMAVEAFTLTMKL